MKKILTSIKETFATDDAELNAMRKRRYVCIVLGGMVCVIFWNYVLYAYLYFMFILALIIMYYFSTVVSLLNWMQRIV
jgi:hypothetical protein